MSNTKRKFLTTKQLPEVTGFSVSYFEKGRIYGYGPSFIRVQRGKRTGKVLYRESDVLHWLEKNAFNPEGSADV